MKQIAFALGFLGSLIMAGASATETITANSTSIYASSDVKVRLASLKKGDEIEVISLKGNFARIAWFNIAGWITQDAYAALGVSDTHANKADTCTKCENKYPLKLVSHEANMLGLTNDSNDVPYLDFKISLKYPFTSDSEYHGQHSWKGFIPYFSLAFTGRFGQYISTRDSSPVIGKRFNPELVGRYWLADEFKFLDLSIGHESNGQSINSEAEFLDEKNDLIADQQDPEFARDFISRGWDYVGLHWYEGYLKNGHRLGFDLKLRYFLKYGPFQGDAEDSNSWEVGGDNIFRRQYDGITVTTALKPRYQWLPEMRLGYTTGYEDIFRHNTLRLEGTFLLGRSKLPISFWASRGYNSDLVDYYKRTTSFGLALELRSYLGQ